MPDILDELTEVISKARQEWMIAGDGDGDHLEDAIGKAVYAWIDNLGLLGQVVQKDSKGIEIE